MRYTRVFLEAIGYELAPLVVTSAELEARLAPVYRKLHLSEGQLEALTGIRERRWWEPGFRLSDGAIAAARKALAASRVRSDDLGLLIYGGVCREHFEPATVCRVAAEVGADAKTALYDISNACLGVMNGIVEIANRIQLGQIRAGMVVACETAREIVELTIRRLLAAPAMEALKGCLATLTGGSGAAAVLLSDGSFSREGLPRLRGGLERADSQHHDLCRWGLEAEAPDHYVPAMRTDSVNVLKYGVELGVRTWKAFLSELGWTAPQVDKVICHQVGSGHKDSILRALEIGEEKDFSTYAYLGNMGTVSLPLSAALAGEREFLRPEERVGFLGIGSGLNCLMLGWEW